jgi:prevent-host-death family protein
MSAEPIGISEARTHLSGLVVKAQRGERFKITRHGRPVAELGPVPSQVARPERGVAKSKSFYMAPDFDAPLDDFADHA